MFGRLFYQKYIFSTSFTSLGCNYLSVPSQYLKRTFSDVCLYPLIKKTQLNWVINVLLCTASFKVTFNIYMLYNYKYNIQKTFLNSWRKGIFVTVKKTTTCVTVKTFWFIITTRLSTNINQKHEVEFNTFNHAQKHSWC